jgi:hypothetical protein
LKTSQVVPFDVPAGLAYGPIRLATRDSKKDHLDKLIAAHAVSLGVTVVTNNTRTLPGIPVWLRRIGWTLAPKLPIIEGRATGCSQSVHRKNPDTRNSQDNFAFSAVLAKMML